jgi:gluconokinase
MTGDALTASAPTRHVVVMGVSGSGKSTVARGISARTGLLFAEADEFHTEDNVERMRRGVPLDDEHREPWLRDLAAWMAARHAEGVSTVLACSALRRSYRDILRTGVPDLEFVHLDGSAEVIRTRLAQRAGHYMPVSLLQSQIATLEPLQADEHGVVLDVAQTTDDLVTQTIARLDLPAAG